MSLPPAYTPIPVLYDETHHGRWDPMPSIDSMGNVSHLLGRLEHHDQATDGSFSICIAGGTGTFIGKKLYESIPEAHRPPLRTDNKTRVTPLAGHPVESVGTTFLPFILEDRDGKKFIMKLFVHVLPKLLMGMFIGNSTARYITSQGWSEGRPEYEFKLHDVVIRVVGNQ